MHVDIAPSIFDIIGIPQSEWTSFDGISLKPLFRVSTDSTFAITSTETAIRYT